MIKREFTRYTPVIKEMITIAKRQKDKIENKNPNTSDREYLILCNLIDKLEGVFEEIDNSGNPFYKP